MCVCVCWFVLMCGRSGKKEARLAGLLLLIDQLPKQWSSNKSRCNGTK